MKITIDTDKQLLYVDKNTSIKELTSLMDEWTSYTIISTFKPKTDNLTSQELIEYMAPFIEEKEPVDSENMKGVYINPFWASAFRATTEGNPDVYCSSTTKTSTSTKSI